MPDQAKNMLIGIFVTAACAIIIFVMMFLHPSVGDEGKLLHVRFANVDKISLGTRVTFAGKPVGEVIAIAELPDADLERKLINDFVYIYELTLRVDSGVNVFNTDEISSRTSGLLGEKSVAIIPRAAKTGEELRIVNNEIIYATEAASVEDTLKEFKDLSDKLEAALDGIIDALATLHDNKFWENLSATSENMKEITSALNNKDQWVESLANIHKISNDTAKVAALIERGEGTIGKIVMNDELYLRLTSLFSKGEVVMNDINHYGILFHTDKGWQRLRARRMNLLQKLSTPMEFRNYFNDEIDNVTTSLERVSSVLEQLEGQSFWGCYDLLQNREFTKVYSELLRRVGSLEEELRMYNQQVVNEAVRETESEECYYD